MLQILIGRQVMDSHQTLKFRLCRYSMVPRVLLVKNAGMDPGEGVTVTARMVQSELWRHGAAGIGRPTQKGAATKSPCGRVLWEPAWNAAFWVPLTPIICHNLSLFGFREKNDENMSFVFSSIFTSLPLICHSLSLFLEKNEVKRIETALHGF